MFTHRIIAPGDHERRRQQRRAAEVRVGVPGEHHRPSLDGPAYQPPAGAHVHRHTHTHCQVSFSVRILGLWKLSTFSWRTRKSVHNWRPCSPLRSYALSGRLLFFYRLFSHFFNKWPADMKFFMHDCHSIPVIWTHKSARNWRPCSPWRLHALSGRCIENIQLGLLKGYSDRV